MTRRDAGLEVRSPDPCLQRLVRRRHLDRHQVGKALFGVERFLVGGGEAGSARQRLTGAGRAGGPLERILPALEQLAHLKVEHVFVRFGMAAVEADDQVNAGERAVVERGIVGRCTPSIGIREDPVGPRSQLGIVAVARHEEQGGNIAVEPVAADEQLGMRADLQVKHALADAGEVAFRNLEQFVAWIILQHGLEPLAREPRAVVVGRLHDRQLAPDQRRLVGRPDIGGRGEQADKARLAHHAAARVIAFDADIIGVVPGDARAR